MAIRQIQFFVQRFVNNTHAALADLAQNPKAAGHALARLERAIHHLANHEQRLAQESAHPEFPVHPAAYFLVELGIAAAGGAQKGIALLVRAL